MNLHSRKTILTYQQIKQISTAVTSRHLLKEFTHAEYYSIKKSLAINPFLRLLIERFPPIDQSLFHSLIDKAERSFEKHNFINEIHHPLLKSSRNNFLLFLESNYQDCQTPIHEQLIHLPIEEKFRLGSLLKSRLKESIQKSLENPFTISSIFKEDLKGIEQVLLYLDFIEQRLIHEGDVGAKSLWLITEWILSETHPDKFAEKSSLLLLVLYESSIIYRFEPIKIFDPYDFSCLPGLTQRLFDEGFALYSSDFLTETKSLEEKYFDLMIDQFISIQKTPTDFFKQIILSISLNLGARLIEKELLQLTCKKNSEFQEIFINYRMNELLTSFDSLPQEKDSVTHRKKLSLLKNYLENEYNLKKTNDLISILKKEYLLYIDKYTKIRIENIDLLPELIKNHLELFECNKLLELTLEFSSTYQENLFFLIKDHLTEYLSPAHLSLISSLIDIDSFIDYSLSFVNTPSFSQTIFHASFQSWRSKIHLQHLAMQSLPFIYALWDHPKIFPQIIKEKILSTQEEICCCEELLLDAYEVLKFEINSSLGVFNIFEQNLIQKSITSGYMVLLHKILEDHERLFHDFYTIRKLVTAYSHTPSTKIESMISSVQYKEPHLINKLLKISLIYDNPTITNFLFSQLAIQEKKEISSIIQSTIFNDMSLFENFLKERKPQLMILYLFVYRGEIDWDLVTEHLNLNPDYLETCIKIIFNHHGINNPIKIKIGDCYEKTIPILFAAQLNNHSLIAWLLKESCFLNQHIFLKILSKTHHSMTSSIDLVIQLVQKVPSNISFHSLLNFLNENFSNLNENIKELIGILNETGTTHLPRAIQDEIYQHGYHLMLSYLRNLIKKELISLPSDNLNKYEKIYDFIESEGCQYLISTLMYAHELHFNQLLLRIKRHSNLESLLENDPSLNQCYLQLVMIKMKSYLGPHKTEKIIIELLSLIPNLDLDQKIHVDNTIWPLFSYLYDSCQMNSMLDLLIKVTLQKNKISDTLIIYIHSVIKYCLLKDLLDSYFKIQRLLTHDIIENILQNKEILRLLIERIIQTKNPISFEKELVILTTLATSSKLICYHVLEKNTIENLQNLQLTINLCHIENKAFDILLFDLINKKMKKPSLFSRVQNLSKIFSNRPQIHHEDSQERKLNGANI